MSHPFPYKKAKNGNCARKKELSYRCKNWHADTQLDSVDNMGLVRSGYISSSLLVRLNMKKKIVLLSRHFDLVTFSLF